jgi:PAS domain S-box-containing protein
MTTDNPHTVSTAPLRILVVEDESLVALDLEERLIQLGYEVTGVVDNSAEALSMARAVKVDLVLMDIHIRGDADGIETAVELRRMADIPVVFLTAHADEATLQRAGLAEPFGYVLKPFDERELRATIQMARYRYQAEARVRKMERWLATTLRSIGDGVIATDSEGRITFINAMAEALSGWMRGEAVGRHLSEVFAITTQTGPDETFELLHRAMTEGVVITLGEGRCLRTRDGRLIPVDDSLAPIRDDRGFVTGCIVIFRDNTTHREAEKERRRLEAKMQEAQRLESLGVMASGIAHDFNNLLVSVTCTASLGRLQSAGNPLLSNCFSDIESAGQRAAQLCQQMLTYAGQGQVKMEELKLSDFTRETVRLLQVTIHKSTTLELDLAEGLRPIMADHSQLQQVIMNLVINGSEALDGKSGNLTVRTGSIQATKNFLSACQVGDDLKEGEYVVLEVTDTGHGMTPEVLARIFDPFFTTKFTGRGLGLAAISGIVRAHGGALWVESKPGEGTTFQALFPPVAAPAGESPSVAIDPHWRGSGLALLVDDEIAVRRAGSAALRHLGFEVEVAEDGVEALQKLSESEKRYSVMLLDLTMPKLDGHAVYEVIRASHPLLPVLLMSGYASEQASRLFKLGGPIDFLQKPFIIRDLIGKLQLVLKR